MRKEFLKEVITSAIVRNADDIIKIFSTNRSINEFTIAKKLDLTINQTRNILYKILDQGLLSSTRKKDKKKGWYTYYWKIEFLKCFLFLRKNVLKRLDQIEHQITSREKKQFYLCKRCNIKFNEENSLNHNFTCYECGGIFVLKDNSKIILELKKHLKKFQTKLNGIDAEIDVERNKITKAKEKVLRKEAKEKVLRKEAQKKARALARQKKKKLEEKTSKKTTKTAKATKKTTKKTTTKKTSAKKTLPKKVTKKSPSKKTTTKKSGNTTMKKTARTTTMIKKIVVKITNKPKKKK